MKKWSNSYYENNRRKCLEYGHEYYENNKEKRLEYQNKYNQEHKEELAKKQKKRRNPKGYFKDTLLELLNK